MYVLVHPLELFPKQKPGLHQVTGAESNGRQQECALPCVAADLRSVSGSDPNEHPPEVAYFILSSRSVIVCVPIYSEVYSFGLKQCFWVKLFYQSAGQEGLHQLDEGVVHDRNGGIEGCQ